MSDEIPAYDPNQSQEERLKAWNKEKQGLINDLQTERGKRQELENRFASLEERLNPKPKTEDKVTELAQDPDGYIEKHVAPLKKEIGAMRLEMMVERGYEWLAEQEGSTPRKIKGSELDKELNRIVTENGLNTLHPIQGIQNAYKIYLQEKEDKKKAEQKRTETINGNTSETSRRTVVTTGGQWTRSRIRAVMKNGEYDKYRDEIIAADKAGAIVNDITT